MTATMVGIVDDDEAVRTAVARLLRSAGYKTAMYASAEEFFASPDLPTTACLVVDVTMPGMGGLRLQERLAADGHQIPVIILTGHPDATTPPHAKRLGAVAFLAKPANDQVLLTALANALATR